MPSSAGTGRGRKTCIERRSAIATTGTVAAASTRLQERRSRDLEQAARDARDDHGHERGEKRRRQAERDERGAAEKRGGDDNGHDPRPSDEQEGRRSADHGASAIQGRQVAGTRAAQVENTDCEGDGEDVECTDGDERRRQHEQHLTRRPARAQRTQSGPDSASAVVARPGATARESGATRPRSGNTKTAAAARQIAPAAYTAPGNLQATVRGGRRPGLRDGYVVGVTPALATGDAAPSQ